MPNKKISDLTAAVGISNTDVFESDTGAASLKNTWALFKSTLKTYFDTLYQGVLGYTPENVANKDTDTTLAADSDIKYPSQKAVKTYVDNNTGGPNVLIRSIYATGTLTLDTQPSDGQTIIVGSTTYEFTTSLMVQPQIEIGVNLAVTKVNIVAALNGTDNFNPSNAEVYAVAFVGNGCVLTAQASGTAGNAVALGGTFVGQGNNGFGGATFLTGGTVGTTTEEVVAEHLSLHAGNPQIGTNALELFDANNTLVSHLDSDGGAVLANGNVGIAQQGNTTVNYDSDGNPLIGNVIFSFSVNTSPVFSIAPGGGFNFSVFGTGIADELLSAFAYTNQTADLLALYDGFTFGKAFRVLAKGAYVTSQHTVPADGDLATGDMAIWFDQTPSAAKLMIKAKDSDGTVVTGSVNLT